MTNRERLLGVFEHTKPDVVPFAPDLTYYYGVLTPDLAWHYANCRPEAPAAAHDEAAERFLAFHLDHRCIPYYQYQVNAFRSEYLAGVAVEERQEDDNQTTRFTWGGRSLLKVFQYHEISHSSAPIKYPVETADDLKLLLKIVQHTTHVDTTADWDRMDALFGARGFPICAAPRSPLPALLTDWAGVENTVFLMRDEPALCREVMEAMDRAHDRAFEILCRCRAPLIHFCDNLSACVIAGWWDEWVADYYRRRTGQLRAAGKRCVSHLDGTLNGMIERLARSGLDGIESITPAPVGDLSLDDVNRQLAGHDTIIWGGVPGAMFCPPFTWEDVRRQVDALLSLNRQGRRVVVSSADQVPPNGDIRLVQRIGEYLELQAARG
jgi:hypothetical protein